MSLPQCGSIFAVVPALGDQMGIFSEQLFRGARAGLLHGSQQPAPGTSGQPSVGSSQKSFPKVESVRNRLHRQYGHRAFLWPGAWDAGPST